MSSGLSRRALLRALVPADESAGRLALIGAGCVEPKGVTCRRCGEICPQDAIRFVPLTGGRAMAHLEAEACNGCGECLIPCPTRAISLVARDAALVAREAATLESRP